MGEARAVLDGSAKFVGAVVEERRDKLLDEKAVASVQKHPVESRCRRKAPHLEEVAADLLHHLAVHPKDVSPILAHEVVRSPRLRSIIRFEALVGHLEVCEGTTCVYAICILLCGVEVTAVEVPHVDCAVHERSASFLEVERKLACRNAAKAALGTDFDHAVDVLAYLGDEVRRMEEHGWRRNQSVAIDPATNLDGIEYMGILLCTRPVRILSSCLVDGTDYRAGCCLPAAFAWKCHEGVLLFSAGLPSRSAAKRFAGLSIIES